MKKIILSLVLFVQFTVSYAVTNFLDLAKTTQRQSQWVQQFDKNTKQGGGYFKYYNESNTGIQHIAGYQIKVAGSATGYYRRVDPTNQFNVVWCGAQNKPAPLTLAAQGWTQAAADSMWPGGVVQVSTDTYDRVATAYALKLMETKGFQVMNWEPKDYFVNPRDCQLPVYFGTSPYEENLFDIRLNSARFFFTSNSTTVKFFNREPPSNSDALVYYVRGNFLITGGQFYGKGDGTAINVGGSYGITIQNCFFDSLDHAIVIKFCLNPSILGNKFLRVKNPMQLIDGDWPGAGLCNSQTNMPWISKNKIYCKAVPGQTFAAIYMEGLSGAHGIHNIVEGGNPMYNVYYDNLSATCVKDFYYGFAHHENTPLIANIYIRSFGLAMVENIFTQTPSTIVDFVSAGGYPQIKVSNFGSVPSGSKFRCTDGGVTWIFNQIRDLDPKLSGSWDLTGGGIRPNLGPSNQRLFDNFDGAIR